MCIVQTTWEKVIDFHGHYCPGLAIGHRAAETAMNKLGISRDSDEQLVAIVENDSCAIDAIQVLTGCTVGKGNMIFKNTGKQVYTIGERKSGRAIRVALKYTDHNNDESMEKRIAAILDTPVEELFNITEVKLELPEKARIFKSVQCNRCGEGVAEPKARVKDGKYVCPECAGEEYTRGW